eukprot:87197_1
MNLKYVEPTVHDYPTQLDERIAATKEHGTSACCTFNRRGTLLAIGCREGHINVWDFETRSIATRLIGHKGIVTSVSWSRNGSKLLSSDWNGSLLLWDIATSTILIKIQFDRAIEHSWLHGRSTKLAMIHLHECEPLVLTFHQSQTTHTHQNRTNNNTTVIHTDDKTIKLTNYSWNRYQIHGKPIQLSDFASIEQTFPKSTSKKKKSVKKKARITCAVFDKYHKHIYCGTSHGRLLIVEYKTWRIINSSDEDNKITNSQQQIKSIVFSRCGNFLVINCGDRIIRYIDIADNGSSFAVQKQYQDAVERKNWNACCFSSNGEYICAASATQQCIIYIWQRCYERSLEKVLKGPDSFVVDMVWHPIQPILISVTQCGEIQIWNQGCKETGENWSTFDANFQVLTENVWDMESKVNGDHVEVDEEEWMRQQLNKDPMARAQQENVEIDIFKEDGNLEDFFSADEDENDLLDVVSMADSLHHELIHLPIQVQCRYSPLQISNYLKQIKQNTARVLQSMTDKDKGKEKDKEKIKEKEKGIKISNKNEKVLQNLTKHLGVSHAHAHAHHHAHHLNAKKRRKKKQKYVRKDINHNNNSNVNVNAHALTNPFKSFGNSYNTLKMNASNVHKPNAHKRVFPNNNYIQQPPTKKQKM